MVLSIVVLVITLYGGLTLLLYLFQSHLIYYPVRALEATPADIGLAYTAVRFEASDGVNLSGWFIPAGPAAKTVLFFHGNAGNISHRLESIAAFHKLGLNVFIIDYRGYGQSEGRPSEQGTYRDAEAAWTYLVDEKKIAPETIIIFGRSLGGGVAAWLAQQHPPGLLILESTFTSAPDMAARYYPFLPVRWLARVHYNTLARLPEIDCPVLIVHSPDDDLIPYSHGQRLFAAAGEPKAFVILQGGHNEGFIISAESYIAEMSAFIDKHVGRE